MTACEQSPREQSNSEEEDTDNQLFQARKQEKEYFINILRY